MLQLSPHYDAVLIFTCALPVLTMRFTIQAEKLYHKFPQLKSEDVEILQEWLKKQPHLPELEESQVILFLHSCYYRTEGAKAAIDNYFTRRTLYPHIFRCATEDTIRKHLAINMNAVMPKQTPEGYDIFLAKLLDFRTDLYDFMAAVNVITMETELHLHKNGPSDGLVAIFDTKGFSLGHLARINLTVLKHILAHIQEGLPVRVKGLHFVNTVPFMDKILGLVKPFVTSELYSTIQLHSSFDTLYKVVPKECLPEEYGGDLPKIQTIQDEKLETLLNNRDFFTWHNSQKVDESKRTEKMNGTSNVFGMDGTFKKLVID